MSTIFDKSLCSTTGANTGFDNCGLDMQAVCGMFILQPGYAFSGADIATEAAFLAAIKRQSIASVGRLYPLTDLVVSNDGTEASVVITYNNGAKRKVRNGAFDQTFDLLKGGKCLISRLSDGFDGKDWDVLMYDATGQMLYTKNPDGSLSGLSLNLFDVLTSKQNDGSKPTQNAIHLNADGGKFTATQIYKFDGGLGAILAIKGLMNVALAGTRITNVGTITGKIGCGKTDLAATFGVALDVAGAWIVKDGVTGNGLTITSVAANTNVGGYDITLDTSDPDYVAGHSQIYSLNTPTVLAGLGTPIPGVESNSITIA